MLFGKTRVWAWLGQVFLYTSDFLMALRESLAEATEWRKGLLGSWLGGLQSWQEGVDSTLREWKMVIKQDEFRKERGFFCWVSSN